MTEHVSKIYASVTNCDALQLISPLLLPPHRFSVCLSVRPSDLSFEVFLKKKEFVVFVCFSVACQCSHLPRQEAASQARAPLPSLSHYEPNGIYFEVFRKENSSSVLKMLQKSYNSKHIISLYVKKFHLVSSPPYINSSQCFNPR